MQVQSALGFRLFASQECQDEQHKEYNEQDFRYRGCQARQGAESQRRRDDRNQQKDQGIVQHGKGAL